MTRIYAAVLLLVMALAACSSTAKQSKANTQVSSPAVAPNPVTLLMRLPGVQPDSLLGRPSIYGGRVAMGAYGPVSAELDKETVQVWTHATQTGTEQAADVRPRDHMAVIVGDHWFAEVYADSNSGKFTPATPQTIAAQLGGTLLKVYP